MWFHLSRWNHTKKGRHSLDPRPPPSAFGRSQPSDYQRGLEPTSHAFNSASGLGEGKFPWKQPKESQGQGATAHAVNWGCAEVKANFPGGQTDGWRPAWQVHGGRRTSLETKSEIPRGANIPWGATVLVGWELQVDESGANPSLVGVRGG